MWQSVFRKIVVARSVSWSRWRLFVFCLSLLAMNLSTAIWLFSEFWKFEVTTEFSFPVVSALSCCLEENRLFSWWEWSSKISKKGIEKYVSISASWVESSWYFENRSENRFDLKNRFENRSFEGFRKIVILFLSWCYDNFVISFLEVTMFSTKYRRCVKLRRFRTTT